MDDPWGDGALAIKFDNPSLDSVAADGIVAVGDQPAYAAAVLAEKLGLRFHPSEAVRASKDKFLARQKFYQAGLSTPNFRLAQTPQEEPRYPCVVKPLGLSGSRGVIRANNTREFRAAFARDENIAQPPFIVEDFIPGHEYALEGIVTRGRLQVLALFDKPDPLDGPFFEETIYVTVPLQPAISEEAQRAVTALGLTDGPIHAEMRVNDRGVHMLEVAARPIGGLCARVLRFAGGMSLEELILRHAIGEDVSHERLEPGAHAVMMIPIPRAGIFERAGGIEEARAVAGIEDVAITAKQGQNMVPLPEGASYLGFVFARAETPEQAVAALRQAHRQLTFEFALTLPVVR
jgi:biotin carboxylase